MLIITTTPQTPQTDRVSIGEEHTASLPVLREPKPVAHRDLLNGPRLPAARVLAEVIPEKHVIPPWAHLLRL
ncbi:hypothetical protein E2C01_078238 [Portunus trituberculatus]|uniref:Uncharacterized protein n=1 Tax=Portunus trituberculatus TaxID=210409 RepID=A0A5B7IPK1_PORTR|nr:hypothetical protein [Portunus trituberculatus]